MGTASSTPAVHPVEHPAALRETAPGALEMLLCALRALSAAAGVRP